MNNRLIHKIFGRQSVLNRAELDSALNSPQTDHAIELKLISSEFEEEAVEGFRSTGLNTASMTKIDQKLQKTFSLNSNGGFQGWFIATWVFGFLALLISSFFFENKNVHHSSKTHSLGKDDLVIVIDNKATLDESQIEGERFTVAIKNSDSRNHNSPNVEVKNIGEKGNINYELPQHMEVKAADLLTMRSKEMSIGKPRAKEIALSNFIFIDFRGVRADKPIKTEIMLTGTGANLSNRDARKDDNLNNHNIIEMSYHDYLTEAAEILNRNDFKGALARFNIILKHYPKDENGLFYSAYCLFQMSNFQESLDQLMLLSKSIYANFDEECEWYILKCYSKLNRMSDAIKLAEQIVERNGFYSEQARDFLRKR
jgi:hypothetical protein